MTLLAVHRSTAEYLVYLSLLFCGPTFANPCEAAVISSNEQFWTTRKSALQDILFQT